MTPRSTILSLALLGAACSQAEADSRKNEADQRDQRPPLVRIRKVELRQVRAEVRDTSYLEAEASVTLQSKVSGRVLEVLADLSQSVVAGQPLAQLDDREMRTTLAQVEVQLADANLRHDVSELEQDAAKGRLEQARIESSRCQAEYDRVTTAAEGIFSLKVVDEAKFAFENAQEAVRVSEYDARKATLEVAAAKNRMRELDARKEEMELQLAEHQIKAPFDGVIAERSITGGETISSATPLFVLVDPTRLIARINRPQRELPMVRKAKEVRFTTDAFQGQEFIGDIDVVSPIVDQATGSFQLRMRVRPDDANVLVAGLFIRARILTEELREALMVPKAAVLADGELSTVFAVRDGRAVRVDLTPGLEENDWIECTTVGDDGLTKDDVVIVSGHEKLRDQTVVEASTE